jgi:hypothetical protein
MGSKLLLFYPTLFLYSYEAEFPQGRPWKREKELARSDM